MPNQWLQTDQSVSHSNGTGTSRTITMSGTNTTVRDVPLITRTITRDAVATATVTNEDEGFTMSFQIKIRSLLSTPPAGSVAQAASLCPGPLTDGQGNDITDGSGNAITAG